MKKMPVLVLEMPVLVLARLAEIKITGTGITLKMPVPV
jgi:hypothetical protein